MTRPQPTSLNVLRGLSWRVLAPEVLAVLGAVVPGLNAFAMLWLIVAQGWLPPLGTPRPLAEIRDPVFATPVDWAVLVALGAGAATAYLIWWPPMGWGFRADQIETPARRPALLGLLGLVGLFVLLSGDLTLILLTAPAALWLLIRPRPFSAGRVLNGLLLAGGGLPWLAGLLILASNLPTPVFVWWHLMAGAAYGVIPVGHVVVLLLLAALALRFLRLGNRPKSLSPR
jgi:hypothetical protein